MQGRSHEGRVSLHCQVSRRFPGIHHRILERSVASVHHNDGKLGLWSNRAKCSQIFQAANAMARNPIQLGGQYAKSCQLSRHQKYRYLK
jgi:hypothetical protein